MFYDLFEVQSNSRVVSFYCRDDIGGKNILLSRITY